MKSHLWCECAFYQTTGPGKCKGLQLEGGVTGRALGRLVLSWYILTNMSGLHDVGDISAGVAVLEQAPSPSCQENDCSGGFQNGKRSGDPSR